MTDALLVLDDVRKSFGDIVAVGGIDLTVAAGEFVALMGPSGCGKTTTLRMIAGLDQPTGGEIRIGGLRMNDRKPWQRETPLVWQSLALFPYLNVVENVEFGLKMRGLTKRDRHAKAVRWLERLGIGDLAARDVKQISGGQQQRVALARALVTEPQILLLDEPLSSLDAHLRVHMQSELSRLQRDLGITFVYVTHAQSEAFAMANRIAIMNHGEIQQVGSPNEIYSAPANRFVAEFIGTNNILTGSVRGVVDDEVAFETRYGLFSAVRQADLEITVGRDIHVVVAADRVAIDAPGDGQHNSVPGTIVAQEFVGSTVTLFFELEDGAEFRVERQRHDLEAVDLAVGTPVALSWKPSHAFILPSR